MEDYEMKVKRINERVSFISKHKDTVVALVPVEGQGIIAASNAAEAASNDNYLTFNRFNQQVVRAASQGSSSETTIP